MRRVCVILLAVVAASTCHAASKVDANTVIALERGALDRWGHGDPEGYLELMAPQITYFDPNQDRRVDGIAALRVLFKPIAGKIRIDRYEMIDPKVQGYVDVAILTFNLVNFRKQPDGSERPVARWNSTETYARVGNRWHIVHSHWSYVKPEAPR